MSEVRCKICSAQQVAKYEITDGDDVKTAWYSCFCGTLFHDNGIDKKVFDAKYLEDWQEKKDIAERVGYALKTYLPLIEEMIYGRKFLEVGFSVPHNILSLLERGWIATGIDLIDNPFIKGDFETFKFDDKFDFIYMGHVLESFKDPIKALKNAYEHLNKDGVLMITHPAPEVINSVGVSGFGAWDAKHSHIFMSERELKRVALGLGFEVVLSRINYSQRFVSWNDRHMILQRKYS